MSDCWSALQPPSLRCTTRVGRSCIESAPARFRRGYRDVLADSGGNYTELNMVDSHGQFVWYELMTTDMKAARAFYAETLGLEPSE